MDYEHLGRLLFLIIDYRKNQKNKSESRKDDIISRFEPLSNFSEKPDFSEKSGFLNTGKFLFACLMIQDSSFRQRPGLSA